MTADHTPERRRLRELAEAATPGPWWVHDSDGGGSEPWAGDQAMTRDLDARSSAGEDPDADEWDAWSASGTGSLFHGDVVNEADGRFIAAANPVAVVELLDAIARVEGLCDEWDQLSKGETPTTARIRAAIDGSRVVASATSQGAG